MLVHIRHLILISVFCIPPHSIATPTLALKEADNCGACHKPGRPQRPFLLRRCTLDCQGCHVDPSGAGARSQWGYYYTHTSAGVAAINFFEPEDPLQDTSRVDLHVDWRSIRRDLPGKSRNFPMAAEFTARVRPFVEYLHFTYTSLLLGKTQDKLFRVVREGDRGYREKYSVMIDQIPLNTYVRAYRGTPMYGLRRPNHSLWIRERIGLDQFAMTEAVEIGIAPNVPYFHFSYLNGDPYVASELKQKGMTYHAGLRGVTLGWHLNVSGWETQSDLAKISMNAAGAGLNLFGVILYAERNVRKVSEEEGAEDTTPPHGGPLGRPTRVHPSSTINEFSTTLAFIPGIMIGAMYESIEDNNSSERRSAFVDLHPIPNLQLEVWRRFETGARDLADTLAVAHLYADF